jgi:mgtE-like transporter
MERDFKEILVAELIAVSWSLLAGLFLSFITGKLETIPAFFIILPGFIGMKGSVEGSLGARISSALHKGTLKAKKPSKKRLFIEGVVSFFLMVCMSLFLGLLAFILSWALFKELFLKILFIPLIAVLISVFIELPVFIYSTLWLYSHGHDPDNIIAPYVTSINDVTSIISLVIAVVVFL